MKYFFILALFLAGWISVNAQQDSAKKIQVGIELDALPYATGGYFAAAWAGKDLVRIRILTAAVNKPDWTTTDGFTHHHINAYALVADRFFKSGWKGWWLSGGLVYWKSRIETNAGNEQAKLQNFLLNGSLGYNITLYKKLYLSPWAGLSFRFVGDTKVPVDNKQFTLPFVNPEASLKLGYTF